MEKEYKISWLKVILIILLFIIIGGIIYLAFFRKSQNNNTGEQVYIENIRAMKEVGFEYFKGDNLPTKIGESKSLSLEDMLNNKFLVALKDENGKSCNEQESYIRATKTLDNEYALKVNLVCANKDDYIVTSLVDNNKYIIQNEENSSNTNVANKENNSVSNNKQQGVSSQKTVVEKVTRYNINYVNTCNCYNCGDCESNIYYSVYFESNGGNEISKQLVKANSPAQYVEPFRNGYVFLGWYSDAYLTHKYDFATPVVGTTTLYAKWEKAQASQASYTVSFDANGGSYVSAQTVLEGNRAIRPSNPIRNGYEFLGWYYNNTEFNFNTRIEHDYILVARWQKIEVTKSYTVSFDANGGSYVSAQTVLEGNRAIRPSNPIRNGYEFLGWYYNNTEFNFNTRIEHDYILVARWQKVSTSYSTYCKIKNDTYYSISYISGNKKTYSYDWTIRFDKLNTNNLKITETGYLYNYNDYNEAYIKYNNNRRIEMVNDQKEVVGKTYSVAIPSAYLFQQYSLKADNFSKSLTSPYYYNGYWYTEAQVNIRNYNNLNSSYYASEINNNIYFVPFYFKVKYTDYNSCVDDLASNWAKYSGYEIVNTYTR